jgi:hypothetical protein
MVQRIPPPPGGTWSHEIHNLGECKISKADHGGDDLRDTAVSGPSSPRQGAIWRRDGRDDSREMGDFYHPIPIPSHWERLLADRNRINKTWKDIMNAHQGSRLEHGVYSPELVCEQVSKQASK